MKRFTVITALTATCFAVASTHSPKVVYGIDNRIETYEADRYFQGLASSAAGMLKKADALKLKNHTIMPPATLRTRMNLCEGEKFGDQATPVDCSGFLVGPDLLVTAGHCVRTQSDCDQVAWVFDYKVDPNTGKAPVMIANSKVVNCKEVLEARLESSPDGGKLDYALLRLETKVAKTPLKVRSAGKVPLGSNITVIGHPSGLPQKFAGGAQVVENSQTNYFKTNLDTFGGNSGSAVFNDLTGEVEGILVRGAKDYERSPEGCISVHETTQQVTDMARYGESVSRITDIKTLKNRFKMLKAAKEGDTKGFVKMAAELEAAGAKTINVYDNNMKTALETAKEYNSVGIVEFLESK